LAAHADVDDLDSRRTNVHRLCGTLKDLRHTTLGATKMMQMQKLVRSTEVGPGELGQMETSAGKQNCSLESCAKTVAVVLPERRLCLEHYFEWCYQQLEEMECQVRRRSIDFVKDTTLRAQIEECSNRTLAVSLQHEPLTNLDRSRLLDILLWSGDLLYLMRSPFSDPSESRSYRVNRSTTANVWHKLAR
jgi:hypothetical protein